MEFIEVENRHKKDFEEFVNNHGHSTCMQMWEWCKFRNKLQPQLYKRIGIVDEKKKFHLAPTYALFKFRNFGKVIYIPQGPIWDKQEALEVFARAIKSLGGKNGCFAIIVEPRIHKGSDKFKELIRNKFRYTKRAIQPKETVLVDLTQKEEEILSSFSKTTRYNIRYASRKGIEVKKYTSPSDKDRVVEFYKLLQLTRERKYFKIQPLDYFKNLWQAFSKEGHATLYEAYFKDEILHSLIVLHNNKWAGSTFSGSSRKFSNLKATYLARWESIKDAKAKGCEKYDFFGATKSKDETHPFFYTTQFKLGFANVINEFAGTFEIILDPIKYTVWKLLEKLEFFKFYEDSFLKEFKKRNVKRKK